MKKLMIAVAAAMLGIAANAATVSWYAEDIYEYGGTSNLATDYLLYFLDAAVVGTDAAQAALAANDYSFLSNGYLADYQEDGEAMATGGSYGNGVEVTGYFVVFNAADTASATYAFVSATDVATTGAAGQDAAFDLLGSDSATAANWIALSSTPGPDPIPEPTSGLLMLLGMAGLALRRRRA